jgi:hypothetical protein
MTVKTWKIAAAALALVLAPAVMTLPASAETDAQAKTAAQTTHRVPAHVRNANAQSTPAFEIGDKQDELHHPYHCGIGLMNTPLPCERDN